MTWYSCHPANAEDEVHAVITEQTAGLTQDDIELACQSVVDLLLNRRAEAAWMVNATDRSAVP